MFVVPTPSRSAVRRIAAARLISVSGSVAASVALAVVLYRRTGSAQLIGLSLFIAFAVPAVASPTSGSLSDRFDRRRLLIASDAVGAVCFVAMAAASAPVVLLVLAFAAALASAPFLPASGAMLPSLALPDDLAWANSRLAVARTLGGLVGPAVGGALASTAGTESVFLINAASFAASALVIATLRETSPTTRREPAPPRSGAGAGLRLLFGDRQLRALTLGFILVDAGSGLALPAEVPLSHRFGTGSVGYGAMVTMWALGGVAGARWAPKVFDRRKEQPILTVAASGLSLAFAAVAVAPWFGLVLAALILGGATMSVTGIGEDLLLQRRVPDDVRGRVYAGHIAVVQASLGGPLLFAGAVVNAVGPQLVFGLAAGLMSIGVLTLIAQRRTTEGARTFM
jgi:MFS family permease